MPHFSHPFIHSWVPKLISGFGYCAYIKVSLYELTLIPLDILRSGMAGSYGSAILNFFRNLHIDFHSG
jgi:hypothetical protein